MIALGVVISAGVYAERQNEAIHEQNMRTKVLGEISLIRSALEGQINGNIQLVRGLVGVIATEPDMTQERFFALAANLFDGETQLRNVAAAPDFVVSMIFPLVDNEAVIGLDYRLVDTQREAALRTRDTGKLVLAGPVDLVQGGQGFIGRFPVFIPNGFAKPRFWGVVSAVIDVETLYRDSGLLAANGSLDIAILGKDALGNYGELFYGDPAVLDADPVIVEVKLPSGSWRLAAIPARGWEPNSSDVWFLRLLVALGGVLLIIPIQIAGWLTGERREHIREIRRREEQLRTLSQRLELALKTSEIGVWEVDLATRQLVWDDRMHELYGVTPGTATHNDVWRDRLHPDDVERAQKEYVECLTTGGRYYSDFRVLTQSGDARHIRAIGAVYEDANGGSRIVGVNWDVSRDVALNEDLKLARDLAEARARMLEAAKARIEHNALHDSLTGLPNRRYLDTALDDCPIPDGPNASVALLQIDLDRFKQINDTLGHAAGDAMLVHAAGVLRECAGPDRFVARIGGDEFVVLCIGASLEELAALAEEIVTRMRKPVSYRGHECRFGVSIGIAAEFAPDIDPRRLLVNADIALYRAKSRGRNRYEFFTGILQAEIVRTKRLADEILSGLEQNAFVAYYQPQFDAHTLDISGVEALVRWRHPSRGVLPPHQFMRTAEELNVVSTIDRMMLEQTLAALRRWREQGWDIPKVSVNVSACRLHDETLLDSLESLVINPGMLAFELVESIFFDDSDEIVTSNIERIKELGIDVEIDDFGTGYASIVSLMKLKPKRLKIDRQLVTPIVASHSQRNLVRSIIEIGKSLGIGVVAEGVETMRHAAILRDLGCDHLQGYAFGKPMAEVELSEFLRVQQWRVDALRDLGVGGANPLRVGERVRAAKTA
jgi:diguanylate cyclase (GGDEF)-like protein/PAS domain S-box-containing protein